MVSDQLSGDLFDPPPPLEILDALPFGVSIQTTAFEVIFENKFFREVMGVRADSHCYNRWKDYDGYGDDMCKDCPSQITKIDGKRHKMVRKMVNTKGEEIYVQVTHIPLVDKDGDFDRFIELVEDVSGDTKMRLLNLENLTILQDDVYLAFTNFGDFGGEIIQSLDIPFVDDQKLFLQRFSMFWYTAIGQGDHWHNGFFGPLPVFDYTDYDSFVYSFKIGNPDMKDERFKGMDYIMLIVILRKEVSQLLENRSQVEQTLTTVFEDYDHIDELRQLDLSDLKQQIVEKLMNQ